MTVCIIRKDQRILLSKERQCTLLSQKDQQRRLVRVFFILSYFLCSMMEAALLLKVFEDVILRKLFIFSIF